MRRGKGAYDENASRQVRTGVSGIGGRLGVRHIGQAPGHRLDHGQGAAALAAVLLALGALLRTRPGDVILGLAVFAGIVAAVGGASPTVLVVSWALGVVLMALRAVAAAAWRWRRRPPILKSVASTSR